MRCPFRRHVGDSYDPAGSDGAGRNRLRIEIMPPSMPERCLLKPKSLSALWAGIERSTATDPGLYGPCCSNENTSCALFQQSQEASSPQLTVREHGGQVWLLNRRKRGWGEFGRSSSYSEAAAYMANSALPLRYGRDEYGEFVEVPSKESTNA